MSTSSSTSTIMSASPSPGTTTPNYPKNLATDQSSIAAWNRGPITSLFVHPPSCTDTFTFRTATSRGDKDDFYVLRNGAPVSTACYPRGTNAALPLEGDEGWGVYYYSPAICPSGWTAATTFKDFVPYFGSSRGFILNPETTAAVCCPAGFSYKTYGHACSSTVTEGQSITFVSQSWDGAQQTWVRGPAIRQQQFPGVVISGDGVPIMWQSSDAAVLSRAATLSSSTTARPYYYPVDRSSESKGLSTGAKIGIGVGVPVAVLVGLLVAWWVWRRRVRRKGGKPHEVGGISVPVAHEKYTSTAPASAQYGSQTAYAQEQPVQELPSNGAVHELPGTGTAQHKGNV